MYLFQSFSQCLISNLIMDCIYLGECKNFTFQVKNDRRTVETSLLFNVNFFSEITICVRLKFSCFVFLLVWHLQSATKTLDSSLASKVTN